MPRTLSTAVQAAIVASTVKLAIFVRIAFADNTYYLFSGVGTITPAGPPANPNSTFPYGQTFTGLGQFTRISAIPQTTKIQAQNITLSLSGIPAALVAEVIDQVRINGTATVWFAFFDSNNNLLTDPVQVFSGSLDVPSMTDAGESSEIAITCENTLLSLNLAPNRRFDDPDQQLKYPGDLGFSFVQSLQNLQTFWPNPVANTTPYPVYMTVTPSSIDLPVGGLITVSVTIHYSDGSTHTQPGNTGSGPTFVLCMASSNPRIAKFDYGAPFDGGTPFSVIGVSPGECNLMARVPGPANAGGFGSMYRAIASIFVHN